MFNRLTTILKEMKRNDLADRVKRAANADLIKTVLQLVSSASVQPYAVICHGDLTVLNTMFRKNDAGKMTRAIFAICFARNGPCHLFTLLFK